LRQHQLAATRLRTDATRSTRLRERSELALTWARRRPTSPAPTQIAGWLLPAGFAPASRGWEALPARPAGRGDAWRRRRWRSGDTRRGHASNLGLLQAADGSRFGRVEAEYW